MDWNPAKSQYLIFTAVISSIISFFYNFFFIGAFEGTSFFGFPISIGDATGFSLFLAKCINTFIMALFLILPVGGAIAWFQRKTGRY